MKRRITIEGDWRYNDDGGHWWMSARQPGGLEYALTVPNSLATLVEDVPDPLPTEPGERFWGKTIMGADAAWWFVTQPAIRGDVCDYTCADGARLGSSEVERLGLVRLPDPDVTP